MGTWAYAPWDNDGAADWYGDFMDHTKLRDTWLEGISRDPNEAPDIVRAAAALFIMLGRVYVWPIHRYDEDLERAIVALTRVSECNEYAESPELIDLIAQELYELKSRRKPDSGGVPALAAYARKPWWKFWA